MDHWQPYSVSPIDKTVGGLTPAAVQALFVADIVEFPVNVIVSATMIVQPEVEFPVKVKFFAGA